MKPLSGGPSLIRDINRANVLDIIRRGGPISQTQIAKILGLQPSTILRIVTDLIDEELIVQTGKEETGSRGGRRASLLELNPKGAYAIGVDIDANEIIMVLVDLRGEVVNEIRRPSPAEEGKSIVMEAVKDAISELLSSLKTPTGKVLGVGVSIPGKVDSDVGVSVYTINFKNWSNVPVAQELEETFQLPVYVEHDIRSMAFGEMWFGEECQNMICLGFRSGIGLGLVVNGELYRGSNQFSGDVGHVVVDPDGPLCSCGRKGCLEVIASEKTIVSKYYEYIAKDNPSASPTIQEIYHAMKSGDPAVLDIIKQSADHMAKVLTDLVRVIDPERIIIGGNSIATSSEFLQFVRSTFQDLQPNYVNPILEVESTHFGDNGIAIGSAAIILSRLFKPTGVNLLKGDKE